MRRVYVLAVLSLTVSLAQDPKKASEPVTPIAVSRGMNFFSIQKEGALGKQMALQMEREKTLVTDPVITEYVNRLGRNLARHADAKFPLTIKVIEGDDPNAITLPGGYIYVQTGLIRTADTEAELAAALAHEIGHVAARHATRQATDGQVAQISTIPLIFLGGVGGVCGIGGANALMPVGFLAIQRGFETEADRLGLQYLYSAGYDPLGMIDIFEKILSSDERKHAKFLARFSSTHPDSADRLVNVQKNIETSLKGQAQYVVTTSEFSDIQKRVVMLDWDKKPEPVAPKAPTLLKPGEQAVNSKNLVPQVDARASQIKEAYTGR